MGETERKQRLSLYAPITLQRNSENSSSKGFTMSTKREHLMKFDLKQPTSLVGIGFATMIALPLTAAFAGGDVPILNKVVEHGDPAVGLGKNLFFADFGMHPDIQQIIPEFDVSSRIDNQGNVSFHAWATEDGEPGECPFVDITMCPPAGLFRTIDGKVELIIEVGAEAPGFDEPFLGFPVFIPTTPKISNGRVVLAGDIGTNPFQISENGLWTDRFGPLDPFVIEGLSVLPEMPRDGQLKRQFFFEIDQQTIFFAANFDTEQLPTDHNPQGLWRNVDGTFEPISVAGMAAPGMPEGIVFGDTDNLNLQGTLGTFTWNNAGRMAFSAFLRGPGLEVRNDEAIWLENDGEFEVFLVEGSPVPPDLFPPGSTFSGGNVLEGAFSGSAAPAIQMNEDGDLVFFSEVDVPGDPPKVPTVWSNRTGELELVLRGRQRGVAFSEFGDVVPGVPNGHFFFPNNIDIRENGDVVIRAFVETNNNLFDSTIGIWVRRGDEFLPVAFEGGPVPDLPGVTFIPETGNVRGVSNFVLEPDGTIVYTGFFVDGQLSLGIFRHEVDGTAAMIFRTSAEADINGTGDDIRTISNFRPGIGSTDTGAKVAEVFFTDGSAGLYTFDVIPDTSIPGDLDGDGTVGASDLLSLLAAWGPCGDCDDCNADLDGNCIVGASDLLILLSNWG